MDELIKVLYVDNEKASADKFCRLFNKSTGYDVTLAGTGEEVLALLLEECPFRLVMADFRLPGISGVELLQQVSEKWPDSIRIVLASYADAGETVEAINQGQIYKFIAKPWNAEELQTSLRAVLKNQDLQQENAHLSQELQTKNAELKAVNENLEKLVEQRTEALEIRNRVLQISQGVLDVLPVAVLGIDGSGMIVQCNDFARDLFPAGFMGPLGNTCQNVFPPEINRTIDSFAEQRTASGQVTIKNKDYQLELRRLDASLSEGLVLVLIPK